MACCSIVSWGSARVVALKAVPFHLHCCPLALSSLSPIPRLGNTGELGRERGREPYACRIAVYPPQPCVRGSAIKKKGVSFNMLSFRVPMRCNAFNAIRTGKEISCLLVCLRRGLVHKYLPAYKCVRVCLCASAGAMQLPLFQVSSSRCVNTIG